MRTSIGYHTFTISIPLTQEDADKLWEDFKRYRNTTGNIEIIKQKTYKNDPFGRHYTIVYPEQQKGISWKMRFCNRGFYVNGEFTPCSIKATINPKVFTGEKSYIVAANASYIEEVEKRFDEEARRISPVLKTFACYSLNRLDYCINFDVSELGLNLSPDLKAQLPKMIMNLIRQGDIPKHYHMEEYNEEYEFYLKSKSSVINCYWKHVDLKKNFADCPDLEESQDIIRFEIQFWYPKVYTAVSKIKREDESRKAILHKELKRQGYYDFIENQEDVLNASKLSKMFRETSSLMTMTKILKQMLSDENCSDAIDKYYEDTIKRGDYYTFDVARRNIEARVSSWEKIVRLTNTLILIREYGSIAKAKAILKAKELEDFRRSLRELRHLGINPVTIPESWGIEYIPSLLENYYLKLEEERKKLREEAMKQQLWEDYMKDRKRKKKKISK